MPSCMVATTQRKSNKNITTLWENSKDSVHSVSGAFVSYFFHIFSRAQEEREYSQEVYKVSIAGSQFARGRLTSQHPQGKKLKGKWSKAIELWKVTRKKKHKSDTKMNCWTKWVLADSNLHIVTNLVQIAAKLTEVCPCLLAAISLKWAGTYPLSHI